MGKVKDLLIGGQDTFYHYLNQDLSTQEALNKVEEEHGSWVRKAVESQHELEMNQWGES
jgi:hypothetical protein